MGSEERKEMLFYFTSPLLWNTGHAAYHKQDWLSHDSRTGLLPHSVPLTGRPRMGKRAIWNGCGHGAAISLPPRAYRTFCGYFKYMHTVYILLAPNAYIPTPVHSFCSRCYIYFMQAGKILLAKRKEARCCRPPCHGE